MSKIDTDGRSYGMGGWYDKPVFEDRSFIVHEDRAGVFHIAEKLPDSSWTSNELFVTKAEFAQMAEVLLGKQER